MLYLPAAWYIVLMMIITGISLAATVLVIKVHHRPAEKQLPVWFRKLVLYYLARLMCSYKRPGHVTASVNGNSKANKITDSSSDGAEENPDAKSACHDGKKVGVAENGQRNDWQKAADILDKSFFFVFLLLDLSLLIIVFALILTGDKYSRLSVD